MTMKTMGFLAAMAMAPLGAQAATVGTFDVTPAVSERDGTPHSLWFETILSDGLSTVFTLSSPGTFIADAVGATLTGSVVNLLDASGGFDMSFTYDRDFSDNTDPTPEFKAVFADVMEHGNEDYFDFESGTVTGTGGFAGLNFVLTRAPADGEFVTQVGGGITTDIGANQHNSDFGLSGWIEISAVTVDMNTCTLCTFAESFYLDLIGTQSDINVNLTPATGPATVPVPAAGLLMLTAIGGIGALSRRRRKS